MEPMASTSTAAASLLPVSEHHYFVPKRKLRHRTDLSSPQSLEKQEPKRFRVLPTELVIQRRTSTDRFRPFAQLPILLIFIYLHWVGADTSSIGGGGGTMPRFANGMLWPPPPSRLSATQMTSVRSSTVVTPPHCSRAIVTASQSSRLTRRSVPASGGNTQMSLNIGVGQTICFRLQPEAESTTSTASTTTTTSTTTTSTASSTKQPEETPKTTTKRQGLSLSSVEKLTTAKSRTTAASGAAERKSSEKSAESMRIHDSSSETVVATSSSTTAKTPTTRKRRMVEKVGRRKRRAAEEGATTESSVLTGKRREEGGRNRQDLLHTVTLTQLEHYHTITERYRFAIPEVETNCICECNPLAWTCQADEWMYGECASTNSAGGVAATSDGATSSDSAQNVDASSSSGIGGACHRTFFPNQPYGTCPNGGGASIGANPAGSTTNADSAYGARLCCQLRFRAYRDRIFTALRLESATTYAILQYSVYRYAVPTVNGSGENINGTEDTSRNGEWTELDRRRVRVQLDGSVHNTILDTASGLKLSLVGLGGRSSTSQLEAGMYFIENFAGHAAVPEWRRGEEIVGVADGGVFGKRRRSTATENEAGVAVDTRYGELIAQPLNRITEHDFHKLGWFRIDENGNGFVQSGDIFLEKIHHAKTNNCAEQRFRSVLEASYYVNRDDQNGTTAFRMAEPLSHSSSWWIRSARVYDASLRQAVVVAGEGNHLEVTLTLPPPTPQSQSPASAPPLSIAFVHNSSRLVDFSGLILVDRFSNSLLNLTVYGARGVLNGVVRQLTDWNGEDIDTFSVNVPNYSGLEGGQPTAASPMDDAATVIARVKPYPVNSVQVVCLRPDDADASREICRPLQSVELDLEVNTVRNEWNYRVGTCENCNRFSVDGFMKYLNPLNWAKGIHSVSDALMLASDVLGYVFGALIIYVVLTRIVIPVVTCCMCPMQILYKKRKRKNDRK